MGYTTTVTVHFKEVDGAGRMFFARIFEYCHDVYEGFLAHVGLPLHVHLRERTWVLPIVHTSADYCAPMYLGDTVQVEVKILKLGQSSLTWQYHFSSADGTPLATVRIVHVAMDRLSQRACPIPDEVRVLLESWIEKPNP